MKRWMEHWASSLLSNEIQIDNCCCCFCVCRISHRALRFRSNLDKKTIGFECTSIVQCGEPFYHVWFTTRTVEGGATVRRCDGSVYTVGWANTTRECTCRLCVLRAASARVYVCFTWILGSIKSSATYSLIQAMNLCKHCSNLYAVSVHTMALMPYCDDQTNDKFVVYYLFEQFVFHFYPSHVLVTRYPLPITRYRYGDARRWDALRSMRTSYYHQLKSGQNSLADWRSRLLHFVPRYRCRRFGRWTIN